MWNYLTESVWNGILLLATGLIPMGLVVFLMQECSYSIRQRLISCFGRTGFIYLTMPGVVIHELSHLFFCLIFQHKIVKVNLFISFSGSATFLLALLLCGAECWRCVSSPDFYCRTRCFPEIRWLDLRSSVPSLSGTAGKAGCGFI